MNTALDRRMKKGAIVLALALYALIVFGAIYSILYPKHDEEHDPPGTYVCHTYSTWNERNYAEFTVERDGKIIACLQASK